MADIDESETPGEGDTDPKPVSRFWRIAAVVSVVAAVGTTGTLGWLLLAGPAEQSGGKVLACVTARDFDKSRGNAKSCPPKGAPYKDGLVEKAKGGDFRIRQIVAGRLGKKVDLYVREPDRAYIDIAHAQTHAALGQPVRVFTRLYKGREIVIYMQDSPLLK